jgi:HSP20 family protein
LVLSVSWLAVLPGWGRVDPGEERVEAGGESLVAVVGPDVLADGGEGGEAIGRQGPEEGVQPVPGRGVVDALLVDGGAVAEREAEGVVVDQAEGYAFFPGSAWAVGPAECMRENDMTVMTSWDLFDDMRTAQDELLRMNRAYGQRLTPVGQFVQQSDTGSGAQAWAPPVDISERKDAYLVAVELPGVAIEDLEITFQDGLLTIQGERHPAYDSAAEKVYRAEGRYGAFRRSITLPSHVMADAIEAIAHDGVLQILVPKATEVRARHIPVRAAAGKAAVTGKAAIAGKAAKNGR